MKTRSTHSLVGKGQRCVLPEKVIIKTRPTHSLVEKATVCVTKEEHNEHKANSLSSSERPRCVSFEKSMMKIWPTHSLVEKGQGVSHQKSVQ